MTIDRSQLKVSNLQLKRYFVTQLNIVANPSFDVAKGVVQSAPDICVSGDMSQNGEDASIFQIKLNIRIQLTAESNLPYSVVIEIVGIIKSSFTGTQENIERVVFVNGSSMLYGTAREIVRSTTALGPYSQILMPTIGFQPPAAQATPQVVPAAPEQAPPIK